MDKQQYISNLHEDFKRVVDSYLAAIAFLLTQPQITNADKRALEQYKMMLKGKDVREIEKSLSEGDAVTVLDKIAKFYKDLSDYALEHINESLIWKQVVRQATYHHIDNGMDLAKKQLNMLNA
jgi:KaiC/GvpD/RAD55 family RecA-like ATPase